MLARLLSMELQEMDTGIMKNSKSKLRKPYKLLTSNILLINLWLFDQSSGHCAYRDDALNVNKMNVKPVNPK